MFPNKKKPFSLHITISRFDYSTFILNNLNTVLIQLYIKIPTVRLLCCYYSLKQIGTEKNTTIEKNKKIIRIKDCFTVGAFLANPRNK